ncbi:MAG: apolipoprotein N-acyltransferase, partial [Acidimicrobiales bacterium]
PDGGAPTRRIAVALVQGGGRRGTSAIEVPPAGVLEAQLDASRPLEGRQDPPALVVWPEDVIAVGRSLAGSGPAATMAALARTLGTTVVAGVTEDVSSSAFRNEAVVWGASGRVLGTYEKVHRVPFGEYVPDRAFFAHLASLTAVPLDAIPGHASGALATPAVRIGVMLSYEVFFATRGRSAVRAGARLLVVPTNTSSYATSQVPAMEVAADRVQAVAEGRALVQAAPTGYSSVVSPTGAVLERSVLGRREVLRATVGLRSGRTVYEMVGDLPVLGIAGLVLLLALAGAALECRRRLGAGGEERGAGGPGA